MMNNEEFERKMEFIVEQQARCAVHIESLSESHARLEEAQEELAESHRLTEKTLRETTEVVTQKIQETNDVVTRLAYVTNEGFKDVNAKINALVDSQIALQNLHRQLDESQKETAQQLKRTVETFDKLADTVDRYIQRRRNGG
jgi:uncharacterized phage infection (PIP) family protein YhgE